MSQEDSVKLDHLIGFSALPGGIHLHPNATDYFYAAGASIVIGNLTDPHRQRILRGHSGSISALSISKSGCMIASGETGDESDAIIWDYDSMSLKHRLSEHDHKVAALAFSDDELLLCTAGGVDDGKLIIWDISTGAIVTMVLLEPSPCTCVTWSGMVLDAKRRPTQDYQLCTAGGTKMCIWSLNPFSGSFESKRLVTEGRGSAVRSVTAFAICDDIAYCATTSGDIMLVNVRKRITTTLSDFSSQSGLAAIAISRRATTLYVGAKDGTVTSLDSKHGAVATVDSKLLDISCTKLPGSVVALSLAPESQIELLAGVSTGSIFVLRAPDCSKCLLISENHSSPVQAVAFSPETSQTFATTARDSTIRIWDTGDYRNLMVTRVQGALESTCLVYTPDFTVSGWTDGKIRAHDICNGNLLWQIDNAHSNSAVTALCLAHNGRFLLSGGIFGDVRVWELRSRELVSHLKEHSGAVTGLALYRDDVHLLSCSRDRSFLCWDLRAEKRITSHTQRMGGINAIALSKEEECIFTVGQEKRITKWQLQTQHMLAHANLSRDGLDEARAVSISHCGSLIATGGTRCELKLWDMQNLNQIAAKRGHSDTITDLGFSPDDQRIISVGNDGIILIWSVSS